MQRRMKTLLTRGRLQSKERGSSTTFAAAAAVADQTSTSPPSLLPDLPPPRPPMSANPPRLMIIGAGSRGKSLARAIVHATNGLLVAVADPDRFRRRNLGAHYIWGLDDPKEGEEFEGWREFVEWEVGRRQRQQQIAARGGKTTSEDENAQRAASAGIDGVFICTADRTHKEIVLGLKEAFADVGGIHIMCEKPMATSLRDCWDIYQCVVRAPCSPASISNTGQDGSGQSQCMVDSLFAVGHGMRYAPHNTLLRKLLLEDQVVGEVVSVEHTEHIGWWHFAHSYVRGNWRGESTSGPSLLTKSCHDIDFLMWLLCTPAHVNNNEKPHLPSTVASFGSIAHFKRASKPVTAKNATNCLSCPIEKDCQYSARKIYYQKGLLQSLGGWPVNVVVPEIEDLLNEKGLKAAEDRLLEKLAEDYDDKKIPMEEVKEQQWYGRCVYETDNDVCDEQTVTITWEDDLLGGAPTHKIEERRQHSST